LKKGLKAMLKPAQVIEIEIEPGDHYSTLDDARRAALPFLVDSMLSVIQELLDSGELIIDDSQLIPNPQRISDEG
jgi:hypothetical protein